MLGISGFELALVVLVMLLVLGPKQLAELAKYLGQGWRYCNYWRNVLRAEMAATLPTEEKQGSPPPGESRVD